MEIAEKLYVFFRETFPQRRCPSRATFTRIDRNLRDTGSFTLVTINRGVGRNVRIRNAEEQVLHLIQENPGLSTRFVTATMGVSYANVWRILRRENLYPYHLQRVQGLSYVDFQPRLTFCE